MGHGRGTQDFCVLDETQEAGGEKEKYRLRGSVIDIQASDLGKRCGGNGGLSMGLWNCMMPAGGERSRW